MSRPLPSGALIRIGAVELAVTRLGLDPLRRAAALMRAIEQQNVALVKTLLRDESDESEEKEKKEGGGALQRKPTQRQQRASGGVSVVNRYLPAGIIISPDSVRVDTDAAAAASGASSRISSDGSGAASGGAIARNSTRPVIFYSSSRSHRTEGELPLWYPLHTAVLTGSAAMVEMLLQANAEVNVSGGVDRRTPLHFASAIGDSVIARMLLNAGADVERLDANGQHPAVLIPPVTAAHAHAVGFGSSGGYTLRRAISQCVQLCAAAEAGDVDVVKAMIGSKKQQAAGTAASANALGMRSRAALHLAVAAGNAAVVNVLLKCRADPNIRAGLCSQDYAESLTGQPPVLGTYAAPLTCNPLRCAALHCTAGCTRPRVVLYSSTIGILHTISSCLLPFTSPALRTSRSLVRTRPHNRRVGSSLTHCCTYVCMCV